MKALIKIFALLAFCPCPQHLLAQGRPEAKVEILDPKDGKWPEGLCPDVYVRIVNTGNVPIRLGRDVVFEVEGQAKSPQDPDASWTYYFQGRGDPFKQVPATKDDNGLLIAPGHAYAMSEADYDVRLMGSEPQRPVRVHFRVENNRWVSSEWFKAEIVADPKLRGEPLFRYQLSTDGGASAVSSADVKGEPWLVLHREGERSAYCWLCRVPPGVKPTSISLDEAARILTIRFDGGEQDVVIDHRNGVPLSGSERTLPHLYLWKQFSGRPFTRRSERQNPSALAESLRTVNLAETAAPKPSPSPSAEGQGRPVLALQPSRTSLQNRTWIICLAGGVVLVLVLAGLVVLKARKRD